MIKDGCVVKLERGEKGKSNCVEGERRINQVRGGGGKLLGSKGLLKSYFEPFLLWV